MNVARARSEYRWALLVLATCFVPAACGGSTSRRTNQDGGADARTSGTPAGFGGASGAGGTSESGGISQAGGASESGGSSSDAGVCHPVLGPYSPHWVPPIRPRPGACAETQVQTRYDDCEGPSQSGDACDAFDRAPANATCLACLRTPATASAYGAIVIQTDHRDYTNIAGCMTFIDGDASADSCAAKYQAYSYCRESSCLACTADTTTVHSNCLTEASTTTCATYYAAEVCASDPKYAPCLAYFTFEESYSALANVFCISGSPPNPFDAGAKPDGSTARPPDASR